MSAVRAQAEAIFQEQAEANAKLSADLGAAQGELAARSTELAGLKRQLAELTEKRTGEARRFEAERAEWAEERDRQRREMDAEVGRLLSQQKATRAQLEEAGKRRAQLESALSIKTASQDAQDAALSALRDQHHKTSRELEGAKAELLETRALARRQDAELAALQASCAELTSNLERSRAALARSNAEGAALRATAGETAKQLAESNRALAERDVELSRLDALVATIPDLETRCGELASRCSALEVERDSAVTLASDKGKLIGRLESSLSQSEAHRSNLEVERAALQTEHAALMEERAKAQKEASSLAAEAATLVTQLRATEERARLAREAARALVGVGMRALHECVGPRMSLPLRAALRAHRPASAPTAGEGAAVAEWLQSQLTAGGLTARATWEEGAIRIRPAENGAGSDPFDVEWATALGVALSDAR